MRTGLELATTATLLAVLMSGCSCTEWVALSPTDAGLDANAIDTGISDAGVTDATRDTGHPDASGDGSTPPGDATVDGGGSLDGCVPTDCDTLDAKCGSPPDGCGGELSCGMCTRGHRCEDFDCVPDCPSGWTLYEDEANVWCLSPPHASETCCRAHSICESLGGAVGFHPTRDNWFPPEALDAGVDRTYIGRTHEFGSCRVQRFNADNSLDCGRTIDCSVCEDICDVTNVCATGLPSYCDCGFWFYCWREPGPSAE